MKAPGIIPFRAIRNIKDKVRPPDWSLNDLWPEMDGSGVVE